MTRSTKPIPVIVTPWERFKRQLVWHPINTDPTDDEKWTVRVWLPLYDCLAVLAGVFAFQIGTPLLAALFPVWVVHVASSVFVLAGLVTLAGVTMPQLWRVEIAGKIMMSFLMTTYAFLVLTFPSANANNAFVTVILIMATWGIYPRLTRLFIRGARREAEREREKE